MLEHRFAERGLKTPGCLYGQGAEFWMYNTLMPWLNTVHRSMATMACG